MLLPWQQWIFKWIIESSETPIEATEKLNKFLWTLLFFHLIIFGASCFLLYKLVKDKKVATWYLFIIISLFLASFLSPTGDILRGLSEEQHGSFMRAKSQGTNVISGPTWVPALIWINIVLLGLCLILWFFKRFGKENYTEEELEEDDDDED
jgi:hypothetical protein